MNDWNYDEEALQKRIADYMHRAKVLRQIHSNKLMRTSLANILFNYFTILVSVLITFLAFFGVQNLYGLFFQNIFSFKQMEFFFNLLVLVLLILAFLQMTLSLGEKSNVHLGSVKMLTEFITDLDDLALMKNVKHDQSKRYIEKLNDRYQAIINVLPSNSDFEWRNSREKLKSKEGNR